MTIPPLENSFAMWFAGVAQYDWVPFVPPDGERCGSEAAPQPQAADSAPAPAFTLVFKGVDWQAYPVWRAHPNQVWDLQVRERQHESEENALERSRHAKRPLSIGSVPSSDAPQSPLQVPAPKLDGKGT